MPPLSRTHATRLLRTVKGKPHASFDDHEEAHGAGNEHIVTRKDIDAEADINSEPLSSDDDACPQFSKPPKAARTSSSIQPTQRRNKRIKSIQVPRQGSFERGRAEKSRKDNTEEEKENTKSRRKSLGEKRGVEEPMFGGMEYNGPAQKSRKTMFGKKSVAPTSNIHAQAAEKGKARAKTFSKKPSNYSQTQGHTWNVKPGPVNDDEEDSDVSLVDDDFGLGGNTITLKPSKKQSKTSKQSSSARSTRPNLLEHLGAYRQDSTPASSQPSSAPPSFDLLESGTSSPLSPPSDTEPHTAPRDSLRTLEAYIADLPEDITDDSICSLCQGQVDKAFQKGFWKDKIRSIRNQTLFCKVHKRRSNQEKYENAGYPPIDWDELPRRIRDHRSKLIQVLRNEQPSKYREQYAGLLRSGRAAALSDLKKELAGSEDVSDGDYDSDTDLDPESTTALKLKLSDPGATGYYGPRGKRVMMETIISALGDEIRACRDLEVHRSGPAAFVQAVLVPEVTIWLIMADNGVTEGVAKEIVKDSGELGKELNEEIDDRVEVVDESEEE